MPGRGWRRCWGPGHLLFLVLGDVVTGLLILWELTDLYTHESCVFLSECYTSIKMFSKKMLPCPIKPGAYVPQGPP